MRNFKLLFMGVLLSVFSTITSVNAATYVKTADLTANTGIVASDTVPFDDVSVGNTDKTTLANIFASAANIGASTIVTVGALDAGSITSNFGAIDNGTSGFTTGADIAIDVDGVAATSGRFLMGGSGDAEVFFDGTDMFVDFDSLNAGSTDFRVQENTTDRLVILTGGFIGNLATPLTSLHLTSAADTEVRVVDTSTSAATSGSIFNFIVDDGAAQGADHRFGKILFQAAEDGSNNLSDGASIEAFAESLWTAGTDSPSRLVFFTTPDSSATLAERLRIDSAGNVSMLVDGAAATSGRFVWGAGSDGEMYFDGTDLVIDYDTQNAGSTDFRIQEDGADMFTILTGGGATFASTLDVSSGTVTGPSGTWDTGGIDIATTDTYAIAGTDVFDNATTLTATVVTSSLTSVGALASGSIATGFGNIATGGTVTIGVDDTGADVKFFGASAGAFALYDESEDTLDVRGATAASPGVIKITTGELTNVDGGILGRMEFQAPLDAAGTDAILVAASIWAEADDTFAADNNTADLVFATAISETAGEKMRLTSAGELSLVSGTLTLSDGGTVTQGAGSGKATAVTLSTYSGQITTDNASLAAAAEVTFTVTNSVVTALDVICVSIADSPDADSEILAFVSDVTSGAYDITLANLSGNEDTGAIVINVIVFRGASS